MEKLPVDALKLMFKHYLVAQLNYYIGLKKMLFFKPTGKWALLSHFEL